MISAITGSITSSWRNSPAPHIQTIRTPVCTDGSLTCPPNDCGVIPSYCGFIEAMAGPELERQEKISERTGNNFDRKLFSVTTSTGCSHPSAVAAGPPKSKEPPASRGGAGDLRFYLSDSCDYAELPKTHGTIVYEKVHPALWRLLNIGQELHVGSQTVWGSGAYRIVLDE